MKAVGRSRIQVPQWLVLLFAVTVILSLGLVIRLLPGDWSLTTEQKGKMEPVQQPVNTTPKTLLQQPLFDSGQWQLQAPVSDARDSIGMHASAQYQQQLRVLFEHGANLLRQGRYPQARQALEMVTRMAPNLPEGYVNLGFVLYEQSEYRSALNAFNHAAELNPYQSNAYYGAALAYERLQDYSLAMGHMRSFIHLSRPENAFLPKARAALWEWEQRLNQQSASAATASNNQQEGNANAQH